MSLGIVYQDIPDWVYPLTLMIVLDLVWLYWINPYTSFRSIPGSIPLNAEKDYFSNIKIWWYIFGYRTAKLFARAGIVIPGMHIVFDPSHSMLHRIFVIIQGVLLVYFVLEKLVPQVISVCNKKEYHWIGLWLRYRSKYPWVGSAEKVLAHMCIAYNLFSFLARAMGWIVPGN